MMKKLGVIIFIVLLIWIAFGESGESQSDNEVVNYSNYNSSTSTKVGNSNSYSNSYYNNTYTNNKRSVCSLCNGNKTVECRVCDGTGENDIYDLITSPVLKASIKPYCEGCDGKGYITCGRCNGSGIN